MNKFNICIYNCSTVYVSLYRYDKFAFCQRKDRFYFKKNYYSIVLNSIRRSVD